MENKPMSRTVLIYGDTLVLAGIAVALEGRPELQVVTLDTASANMAQELERVMPDAVIFDQGQTNAQAVLARLESYDHVLAIGVQANSNQMVLWSSQSARALTMVDLVQAILAPPD
jgi:DNA-binding NarL/FixJ family response regulator